MTSIVFAGTPEFAVPALQSLLQSRHEIVAVYTQPDRPAGRGRKQQQSPVKACALQAGLPVFQPTDFKSAEAVKQLADLHADLMVVAAYGLLLPALVLNAPRLGCVNIHASLLPRWRGASPIQQAILAGDDCSGISLMKMDQGLDTGDVILRRSVAIGEDWTAAQLHDALAPLGAELLLQSLEDIESALRRAEPQDDAKATYAPRLSKAQAEIDWRKPVDWLAREVRAYNPWPVSFSFLDGDSIRLWSARASRAFAADVPGRVLAHDRDGVYVSCADGVLQVTELQFAGRKRGSAAQALNARDLTGCRLGRTG